MSTPHLRRLRLGILVPSSNTEMEPTITTLLHVINTNNTSSIHITAHFSRLRVTQISLSASSTSQFDTETMLAAASLLVDADVHAIVWGGTSAGWLGLETDRKLCAAITERFGIPATTATLALLGYMDALQPSDRRVGLVTPYISSMNDAIRTNFAKEGIEVVDDRGLSITENRAIACVTMQRVEAMLDEVMSGSPGVEIVTVFCTNLPAASAAREWEGRYTKIERKLTVLDSVALTVWGLLRESGVNLEGLVGLEGLGRVFVA